MIKLIVHIVGTGNGDVIGYLIISMIHVNTVIKSQHCKPYQESLLTTLGSNYNYRITLVRDTSYFFFTIFVIAQYDGAHKHNLYAKIPVSFPFCRSRL